MNRYAFVLSQLEIGETRGKQNTDDYLVTWSVKINEQHRGSGSGRFEVLTKGAVVPAIRADTRDRMSGGWTLGPFELEPEDTVVLTVTGTNIGDSEFRIDQEASEKLQIKMLEGVLSAAAGALTGIAGTVVTGLLSWVTNPVSTLLGWEAPERCNGLVFAGEIPFSLEQLEQLDYPEDRTLTQVRVATITRDYTDEATHDTAACGAIARTRVYVSIHEEYGPLSVKSQAIRANQTIDVRRGLRQITGGGDRATLKQLLNIRG